MMEHLNVQPAGFLCVEANATILECLQGMNRAHTRIAVIVDENTPNGNILGVVTESDFIEKSHFLSQPMAYSRPIRAITTKPLHTLPYEQAHQAADYMVKRGIRSVALVQTKKTPLKRSMIVGFIHAFDILRNEVSVNELAKRDRGRRMNIAVISKNSKFSNFVDATLSPLYQTRVDRYILTDIWKYGILHLPAGKQIFAIDIDHYPLHESADCIKALLSNPKVTRVVLIYDEALQSEQIKYLSTRLNMQKKFLAFQKPINPTELFQKINSLRDPQDKVSEGLK